MPDDRLVKLTNTLAQAGVVGVAVRDWNDKSTWTFWREGSIELNCLADATMAPLVQAFDTTPIVPDVLDNWDLITLKIAFNHENRIRALEGKAALTVTQFKAAVRAQL